MRSLTDDINPDRDTDALDKKKEREERGVQPGIKTRGQKHRGESLKTTRPIGLNSGGIGDKKKRFRCRRSRKGLGFA